jgi:hypothetical protein
VSVQGATAWQRLERAIERYPLRFEQVRDPSVELHKFPSMIDIYWSLVEDGLPPQQEIFAHFVSDRLPHLPRTAVMARALRTYPAFVRQHHFELLLREHFDLVLRGHVLDMRGLDFLIIQDGYAYGLGLSVDTQAARDWAQVKLRRNPPVRGIPLLNLAVQRNACTVGQFWLHHPREAEQVSIFIRNERAQRQA